MENLFVNNPSILLFVALLLFTIKDYTERNIIVFAYIVSFLLKSFNIINFYQLILVFTFFSFVYMEFLTDDTYKTKIITKIRYKLLDFSYKLFFEYYFCFFLSILILNSTNFLNFINNYIVHNLSITKLIIFVTSTILLSFLIAKIKSENFVVKTISEVKANIEKKVNFRTFENSALFQEYFKILIDKEDKSFFERENTYTFISKAFIKYKYNRSKETVIMDDKTLKNEFLINFKTVFFIGKKIIIMLWINIKKIINILRGKEVLVGYSTIEMQLLRLTALSFEEKKHYIKRKIFELIYSNIFFKSYKEYLIKTNYGHISFYKEYLLLNYILYAPTKIKGKYYNTIVDLYPKINKNDITVLSKEEFFIWCLGLPFIKEIGPFTLAKNDYLIQKYELDKKMIYNFFDIKI